MKLIKHILVLTLSFVLILGFICSLTGWAKNPFSKTNIKPEVSIDHPMYQNAYIKTDSKMDPKKNNLFQAELKDNASQKNKNLLAQNKQNLDSQKQDLLAQKYLAEEIRKEKQAITRNERITKAKQKELARLQNRRAQVARERAYQDHFRHEMARDRALRNSDLMANDFEEYARTRQILRRNRYERDAHIALHERDFARHQAAHARFHAHLAHMDAAHAHWQAEQARRERNEINSQIRRAQQQNQQAIYNQQAADLAQQQAILLAQQRAQAFHAGQAAHRAQAAPIAPVAQHPVAQQIASDRALAERLQAEEVERAVRTQQRAHAPDAAPLNAAQARQQQMDGDAALARQLQAEELAGAGY